MKRYQIMNSIPFQWKVNLSTAIWRNFSERPKMFWQFQSFLSSRWRKLGFRKTWEPEYCPNGFLVQQMICLYQFTTKFQISILCFLLMFLFGVCCNVTVASNKKTSTRFHYSLTTTLPVRVLCIKRYQIIISIPFQWKVKLSTAIWRNFS